MTDKQIEKLSVDAKIDLATRILESLVGDWPYEVHKARIYDLAEKVEAIARW
jgi:hypothetical protein